MEGWVWKGVRLYKEKTPVRTKVCDGIDELNFSGWPYSNQRARIDRRIDQVSPMI